MAEAEGRLALLGKRRHYGPAQRRGHPRRLREGDARPHRASPGRGRAREPGVRTESALRRGRGKPRERRVPRSRERRPSPRGRAGDRLRPSEHRRKEHSREFVDRCADPADGGRSCPPPAGRVESAHQCGEVHPAQWTDRRLIAARRRAAGADDQGQRDRHRGGRHRARLLALPAGAGRSCHRVSRARARDRTQHRRASWGARRGSRRGDRGRGRVRDPSAVGRPPNRERCRAIDVSARPHVGTAPRPPHAHRRG